jgi:3-hydroxy-9,10-secoandrosta-1,3,5(10)-triene-9,17-dione monooxygenase
MAPDDALRTDTRLKPLPQPEPGLTPEEMIRRAAALRPLLREEQEENDARGHYSPRLHQEFLKAGFYRCVQPKLFGGYEFDFPTFCRVIIEISRGHPSTGWCYTLASSHAMLIGSHWSAEAQAELFGAQGDFRSPHRAPPNGTFKRAEGGYIVNGTWSYSSGVPVCTHFTAGGLIFADGKPPLAINFIVPIDQVEILNDWGGDLNLGMRGSGSNSVRLTDVFVADRFISESSRMMSGADQRQGTPGTRLHGNPMYLGQMGGPYHTTLGAIIAGTARAACDEFEEMMRTRKVMFDHAASRLTNQENQRPFGKALNLTDAAEALTLAAAQGYMDYCARWARDRTPISADDTLRLWGMVQEACFMACEAVELLFQNSGSNASNKGNRIERYLRDVQMYRIHPAAQPWTGLARAQSYLGLPIWMFGNPPPGPPPK